MAGGQGLLAVRRRVAKVLLAIHKRESVRLALEGVRAAVWDPKTKPWIDEHELSQSLSRQCASHANLEIRRQSPRFCPIPPEHGQKPPLPLDRLCAPQTANLLPLERFVRSAEVGSGGAVPPSLYPRGLVIVRRVPALCLPFHSPPSRRCSSQPAGCNTDSTGPWSTPCCPP